ncbi:hypothetical protein PR002_g25841 [Phytophthora rubi]|uniref:Uncharacterized protein n=1 Tax=Phytophthora rubi TaxID=129364 RepID=A0A6A3I0X6_9STRA|nr:hypothetical protein PR002_g25841 [Phytophthora rubi]
MRRQRMIITLQLWTVCCNAGNFLIALLNRYKTRRTSMRFNGFKLNIILMSIPSRGGGWRQADWIGGIRMTRQNHGWRPRTWTPTDCGRITQ